MIESNRKINLRKINKKAADKIKQTLVKLIPGESEKYSQREDKLKIFAISSRKLSTQDVTSNTECVADVLRQLLSEVEYGELMTDGIVELSVSTADWQKVVTGKKKQPMENGKVSPLDVGVRIKRG